MKTTRRELAATLGAAALAPAAAPLVRGIEQTTFWDNLDGKGTTWFHPRICRVPGPSPSLLMTLQSISGSDYFGPVHWSESRDLGRRWSEPRPIPELGRHTNPDGMVEGYCDAVPEYHAATATVLAMAHNVYYAGGKLARPDTARWPVYFLRRRDGAWGPLRRLEWDNPEASAIYTSGCSQRVTLPSGDILVPLSLGPLGRVDRGVCSVRCTFDGKTLAIREQGNVLRFSQGRGLLEPSLTALDGTFYMTIRAENGQGFVARSQDGLEWAPMLPWCWDGGEPVNMSTTQQRWMPHSDALYLVYTRKDASNVNVMRWRAPLFMAEVDRRTLRLVRSTERVVIPMNADGVHQAKAVEHQGNFHTTPISAEESLVSTGTVVPASFTGAVRIARVRWARPNRVLG
ncbi:MAG TPA: sialidase family protein [Bryobacteraceae bacterium]|nr:sialidase family protein [Bryobacteraceae bacterium]